MKTTTHVDKQALQQTELQARCGHLHVGQVRQKSAVLSTEACNPLKILIPQQNATAVWAYSTSYGGGIVSGDQIYLEVTLDAGARLFCGTQASTKIFKRRDVEEVSRQELQMSCAEGSVLISFPDPVVCFEGAVFEQKQSFHCESGASFLAVDWFTAGRVARGERWVFDSLRSHVQLYIDDVLIVDDPLVLKQQEQFLSVAQRMQEFNIFGSMILIGPQMQPLREMVELRLKTALRARAAVIESVSPIADGCIWRFAAVDIDHMQNVVLSHLDLCADAMGGDPWRRRA